MSFAADTKEEKVEISENKNEKKELCEDVIRDLETRGEKIVMEVLSSPTVSVAEAKDSFLTFMQNGADEFKQRTGRSMTYSEMREAWG